ncbi:hypothetical protein F511_04440 [Dorcoceras hygrometricum]|uniref:Uncharacterized protein n=1 Tax=Dorcoceras hygrometricum TaxID=472368 RepID=A0A2Z7CQ06_9LAMI|nr:hypothetical protein F511_04440 [Dorcoceras hygrometricum]
MRRRFEKPNLVRAGCYERVHVRRHLVVSCWYGVESRSGVVLRSELVSALLFTEPYLLRLPAVEDSDWSKIGSVEFPWLRRFNYDHFRRLGLSWKKNAKELQCFIVRLRADLVLLFSQYLCDPQWFRDTASRGPTTIVTPKSQFRTDPSDHGKTPRNIAHDPLGITDSACKNQLVMVSVQYGPLNTHIPIRSTTIGKSRVARDPIAMHTSRRSNSDIACFTR